MAKETKKPETKKLSTIEARRMARVKKDKK